MKVFVTGGSGFVGSAVIPELIAHGHTVLALGRSEESLAKLKEFGAETIKGTIQDFDVLKQGVEQTDGVIHLAFIHDFSSMEAFVKSTMIDRTVVEALGAALEGTNKPFVNTCGTAIGLVLKREVTELDFGGELSNFPRGKTEEIFLNMSKKGIRTISIRLPASTHGAGDNAGFAPMLMKLAKETGVSAYIGDGNYRWQAAHRKDAAVLYRLALEKGEPGTVVHVVEKDEGYPFKEFAEVVGKKYNIPVKSLTQEEGKEHFAKIPFGGYIDNPVSTKLTRERYEWEPKQIGWLEDIAQNY